MTLAPEASIRGMKCIYILQNNFDVIVFDTCFGHSSHQLIVWNTCPWCPSWFCVLPGIVSWLIESSCMKVWVHVRVNRKIVICTSDVEYIKISKRDIFYAPFADWLLIHVEYNITLVCHLVLFYCGHTLSFSGFGYLIYLYYSGLLHDW